MTDNGMGMGHTMTKAVGAPVKPCACRLRDSYTQGVAAIRVRNDSTLTVEQREHWAGQWVAVKDGEVIAAAHNSRDLVPQVRSLGPKGRGAVAQFVPEPSDVVVIGVG